MATRDSNPVRNVKSSVGAAISMIIALNGGDVPPPTTKPGLTVALLADVRNTLQQVETGSVLPSVQGVTDVCTKLRTAGSTLAEMLRGSSVADKSGREFRATMRAAQDAVAEAATSFDELGVQLVSGAYVVQAEYVSGLPVPAVPGSPESDADVFGVETVPGSAEGDVRSRMSDCPAS